MLPMIDLVALLIPNAAALLFPAWFQLGKDTARGFETMGQNLILMFGQILVLIFALVPAGEAFVVFLGSGSFLKWPLTGLVMGAVAAALLLALEAALGIKMLGGVFERFDLSKELQAP
jgi:hypothetical protein